MATTIEQIATQIVHHPTSPLGDLIRSLERIAPTQANVLVVGESGVGKESIVRAIHDLAPWSGGPFVPINCGAIPENLLESELFGYAKGAFTGADRNRPGRFDAAKGGTLFLDEIGELPIGLQVKMLRVLQEKEYQPLGSSEKRKAEFRIVAATNRDLEESVVASTFRQDLFFRLDVVRIEVPALRQRPMDVPVLAQHFLELYRHGTLGDVNAITDAALDMLSRHEWPGNVRELENVVHAMLVIKESGPITPDDVAAKIHGRILSTPLPTFGTITIPEDGINLKEALERLERQLIRQALVRSEGNKAAAAELLGINRTTLVEKLKRNPVEVQEMNVASMD